MWGHAALTVPARCFPRWYGLHWGMQNASSGVSTVFVIHRFGMPNHRHLMQLGLVDSVCVPELQHMISCLVVWAQNRVRESQLNGVPMIRHVPTMIHGCTAKKSCCITGHLCSNRHSRMYYTLIAGYHWPYLY